MRDGAAMGWIGSKRVVAALAVAVVAKSLLVAGLVASPIGPAPTMASGADEEVDPPEVEGNGTSNPDDVTEGSGQGSSDGTEDGSPERCALVCDPLRA